MALRLRRRERVTIGVRRLLQGQVQRIGRSMTAEPLTAEHVHEVRQRLKRLRALLRLLRGQLPTDIATRGHNLCRTLAQSLASSRDATVLAQTLQRLRQDPRWESDADPDYWQRLLSQSMPEEARVPRPDREALSGLCAWVEHVLRLPLSTGGWALLAPGLEHTYRAGRRALRQARALGRDEDFHDWRKRVKDRWYQLALLRRMGRPTLDKQLAQLRRLAKCLGREHDLTMLIERLGQVAAGGAVGESQRAAVAHLMQLAQRARRPLRRRSLRRGQRLYAAPPLRDLEQLHRLWRAWRAG